MELCAPEGIRLQVRQVRRWLLAARQDQDAGIRFLHASYGVGNLDILRQVATDAQIRAATGEDPVALHQELIRLQDAAQRRLRPVLAGAALLLAGWLAAAAAAGEPPAPSAPPRLRVAPPARLQVVIRAPVSTLTGLPRADLTAYRVYIGRAPIAPCPPKAPRPFVELPNPLGQVELRVLVDGYTWGGRWHAIAPDTRYYARAAGVDRFGRLTACSPQAEAVTDGPARPPALSLEGGSE